MRVHLFGVSTVAIAFLFLASAGCTDRSPDGTVPVKGSVLVEGSPLKLGPPAGGAVNFQSSDNGPSGTARIGTDGSYVVRLRPGRYAVAVWAKDGHDTMEKQAKSLIPEKYASSRTSGIEVEVPAKGGNVDILVATSP